MLVNIVTNMNKQWTIHLLQYLFIFVNITQWKYSRWLLVHVNLQCIN